MATRQHALCFVWGCHGFYSIKLKKFTADFIYLIWLDLWLNRKCNYRKVIQTSFQISITSSSLRAVVLVNAFQTTASMD